jgi:2-hydroxychromene-2-carboxylate isomerase
MASKTIEFWYEFASPYSYIAAERIERLAADAGGIEILWRPFVIGPILRQRPGNPSPTQDAPPAQKKYRRRDVQRICEREGIALNWPSTYPRNGLLAARVALSLDPPWRQSFSRAAYRANFVEDREIADEAVVAAILAELGGDAMGIVERAQSPENKAALAAAVEAAIGKGIFGAPSFVVDGEVFWGNDRLEQAIAWAKRK